MIDNWRDLTHPAHIEEDPKCDRAIELSGYLRGTNFAAQDQRVHVAGLGDFKVTSVEALPDPCPTPAMEQAIAKATGKTGRRRLDEKDKKLYAPMSDRSGIKIAGDHITLTREGGFHFNKDDPDAELGEGEQMIVNLQECSSRLGRAEQNVRLLGAQDGLIQGGADGDGSVGRDDEKSNLTTTMEGCQGQTRMRVRMRMRTSTWISRQKEVEVTMIMRFASIPSGLAGKDWDVRSGTMQTESWTSMLPLPTPTPTLDPCLVTVVTSRAERKMRTRLSMELPRVTGWIQITKKWAQRKKLPSNGRKTWQSGHVCT